MQNLLSTNYPRTSCPKNARFFQAAILSGTQLKNFIIIVSAASSASESWCAAKFYKEIKASFESLDIAL